MLVLCLVSGPARPVPVFFSSVRGSELHVCIGGRVFQPTRVAVRVCAYVPHTHTYKCDLMQGGEGGSR